MTIPVPCLISRKPKRTSGSMGPREREREREVGLDRTLEVGCRAGLLDLRCESVDEFGVSADAGEVGELAAGGGDAGNGGRLLVGVSIEINDWARGWGEDGEYGGRGKRTAHVGSWERSCALVVTRVRATATTARERENILTTKSEVPWKRV